LQNHLLEIMFAARR